jgi:hypothetical protein
MPIIDEINGMGEYEEVTRSYIDFLWGTGAGGSLEEGLVLLWAMEKVCPDIPSMLMLVSVKTRD